MPLVSIQRYVQVQIELRTQPRKERWLPRLIVLNGFVLILHSYTMPLIHPTQTGRKWGPGVAARMPGCVDGIKVLEE